jgi:hypothetical protein
VIAGKRKRPCPEHGPDIPREHLTSKTTPSGVQILTYRPAGRATYADVDDATTAEAAPKE